MEDNWFYEKDRNKIGPISEADLRALIRSGDLSGDNLVWTARFGAEWKPISTTDLAEKTSGPPPLPSTTIDNTYAWLIAFVPLFGAVIETMVLQRVAPTFLLIVLGYLAVYFVLVTMDEKRIEASGNSVSGKPFKIWWIFIPVYLFKRANALKQGKGYFWTWIAAAIVAMGITGEAASLFDKNTYWGSGLPSCDSNYMKTQTQQIFRDIPLMKARGVLAIDVKNARQTSGDAKQKKCTATFVTSAGGELQGNFTITLQENDQFYTTLEFQ